MTLKPKTKNGLFYGFLLILGGLGGQGIEYGVEHWQYLPPERIPLELNVIATDLEEIGERAMDPNNPLEKLVWNRDLDMIAKRIKNISERLQTAIDKEDTD